MSKFIIGLAGAAAILFAGSAFAGDVKGVIKSINGNDRTVNVDGQNYYFPAPVDMTGLTTGQTVTLTFTVENNRNAVSKVAK